jgi:hypothetical protein
VSKRKRKKTILEKKEKVDWLGHQNALQFVE